jgi:MarR family transcriptional regulator, 2-MHQ and catechol-resistance regulon repressor
MPTHYKGKPEEVLALDAYVKFTRACSSLEARVMSHNALNELTLSQFGVLETLLHLGTMCQGELSQKLLKSTGNMTFVLDNLEKNGMIRRIRSKEDRRMVMIEMTPAGEKLIREVLPKQVEAITHEMSVLSPDELTEFGRLCRKLGKGRRGEQRPEPVSSTDQEPS